MSDFIPYNLDPKMVKIFKKIVELKLTPEEVIKRLERSEP